MQSIDQWTNRYAFISGTNPWHKDRQRWRDRRASGNCKNTCKYDVLQRNMQIKQAVGGWRHDMPPPRPASGDTIYVMYAYGSVAITVCPCQCNQPKRPGDLDLWPFDLESGVRLTCDVGYPCANFGLPRPLCSQVTPNVRDRQTSDKSIA